jgi:hypothetical protein
MKPILMPAMLLVLPGLTTNAADGKKLLADPWPKDSYYADYPLFHWYPAENSPKPQAVYRFGPVGIGIELTLPAFGMKVRNVEEGSPAAATGKLKAGQIIESINGQTLKNLDPRVILGNLITQAEATDGKVRLKIKASADAPAEEVLVEIPVLGAYRKTWPLNCPKSDKIVRGEADYLAKNGNPLGALGHDQAMLFLLSTGEEKDLEVVRGWVKQIVEKANTADLNGMIPWGIGYGAPGLCEYYLRTGDESVLPVLEKIAAQAARIMYNGGWNHRTVVNFKYGHMNAAGVHVVKFLLLAKECGVKVDEYTLQTSLRHFFGYAGRGNVPYGDGLPETGFTDNGKVGGLAFTMAAAASLTPEGEKSVYAKARDISASKSFYNTSWMLHGHTGGGIGEVWRSSALGLLYDKQPTKYREFMDNRMWHYELSRRFNGAITVLADTDYTRGYDNELWGAGYALTYTVPRKTLRMTGAPPSKFSQKYQLPERPWGTAADDAFYSLVPGTDKTGKVQNVDAERLVTDASWPLLRKLRHPHITDNELLIYARHPEHGVRMMAAETIRGQARDHLIMELLKDQEPRARQAGLMVLCVDGFGTTFIPAERVTEEIVAQLGKLIADKEESWWAIEHALMALSLAKPAQIAPHVDTLLAWLKHDEWWLQRAALTALTPVATDPQFAGKILPAIADMAIRNTVGGAVAPLGKIVDKLSKATPAVQAIALQSFARAYENFPTKLRAPGGMDMQPAVPPLQGGLATAVAALPGGFDELYRISRKIRPDEALPYKHLYFNADTAKFGPELAQAFPQIVREDVIPEYIGENLEDILDESRWMTAQEKRKFSQFAVGALDGLVSLYKEMGVQDYNWHTLGPKRNEIVWEYYSFDLPPSAKVGNPNANAVIAALEYAKNGAAKAQAEAKKLKAVAKRAEEAAATKPADANLKAAAEAAREKASVAAAQAQAARKKAQEGMLAGYLPADVENWFATDFDAKGAGWKNGLAPFANVNGKLAGVEWHCKGNFCGCGEKPNTLWEKQVLLMRTTLSFPPLKPDHRYRLLLGGNIHSKQGDAVLVYLNGKPVHQQGGFGGRLRGQPRGFFLDKALAEEFKSGKVQIAVAAVKPDRAYLSAWLEEMQIPPMTDADITKALTRVPLLSAEWQEFQDPDAAEPPENPQEGKYLYNGKFVDNRAIHGDWTVIDQVETVEAFVPGRKKLPANPRFQTITFQPGGTTDHSKWIWSGNILMLLDRKEALALTLKRVEGQEYLLVESGGFSAKNPKGWQSPLYVMERVQR